MVVAAPGSFLRVPSGFPSAALGPSLGGPLQTFIPEGPAGLPALPLVSGPCYGTGEQQRHRSFQTAPRPEAETRAVFGHQMQPLPPENRVPVGSAQTEPHRPCAGFVSQLSSRTHTSPDGGLKSLRQRSSRFLLHGPVRTGTLMNERPLGSRQAAQPKAGHSAPKSQPAFRCRRQGRGSSGPRAPRTCLALAGLCIFVGVLPSVTSVSRRHFRY